MKNKLIVITGGNSGIGRALVEEFIVGDNQVVVADKETNSSSPAIQYVVDLTQKDEVTQFINRVVADHGTPDVVVLNAGRGIHQQLSEGDVEAWEKVFSLNLFSSLRIIRGWVPFMLRRGSGDIVFISSVSAHKPYPYGGIYCASKAALNTIAETLRLEVQPALRVLNVLPGVVNTSFFENIIDGTQTVENIGWGAVEPQKIAKAIAFAVTQSADISLNQIVIRPTAQPM